MNRVWREGMGLSFLLGLVLAPPILAAEPTTEPLLRMETGAHTAVIRISRISQT